MLRDNISNMPESSPLIFTDDQLLAALKSAPNEIQSSVAVIAMQIELMDRRAAELSDKE